MTGSVLEEPPFTRSRNATCGSLNTTSTGAGRYCSPLLSHSDVWVFNSAIGTYLSASCCSAAVASEATAPDATVLGDASLTALDACAVDAPPSRTSGSSPNITVLRPNTSTRRTGWRVTHTSVGRADRQSRPVRSQSRIRLRRRSGLRPEAKEPAPTRPRAGAGAWRSADGLTLQLWPRSGVPQQRTPPHQRIQCQRRRSDHRVREYGRSR